jgi:aminodeoxyfutalosine synthase
MARGIESAAVKEIPQELRRKALARGRLSPEEAVFLLKDAGLHGLGALAHEIRTGWHGDKAFIAANRHVNYTNICSNRCRFCSYRTDAGSAQAFLLQPDEAVSMLRAAGMDGITELHVVGALAPAEMAGYSYYPGLLRALRNAFPGVSLKAFTVVEIAWMAKLAEKGVAEVLAELKEAGLDAMPGGGAEIFDEGVRGQICAEKISGDEWLAVHRAAHKLDIPTNATMLYGHIEQPEHIANHLLRLYGLQAETGGFQAFVPLPYQPWDGGLECAGSTGVDDLRVLAASRIVLGNIPHIKAYWVGFGLKLAQVMLRWGADDLDGTVGNERIFHAAGAKTPAGVALSALAGIIKGAGLRAVVRDALYRELTKYSEAD